MEIKTFIHNKDIGKARVGRKTSVVGLVSILVGVMVFATGCDVPSWFPGQSSKKHVVTESYVFTIGDVGCTEQEMRVILAEYQRDYSDVYGIDLWTSDNGVIDDLEAYVKDKAITELAQMYTYYVVSVQMGLTLSDNEISAAKTAASAYIQGLTADENAWVDISQSDLVSLFEKYALVYDLYDSVGEGVSAEVSDADALVMDFKQICISDADTAATVLSELDDGTDFDSLAESYNEADATNITVAQDTFDEYVVSQLTALDDDEYSGIINMDGKYYIFYCSNHFDQELTEENKEAVLSQRRQEALADVCDEYSAQTVSSLREDVWDGMELDTSLSFEGASFKDLLEENFGFEM